MFLPNKAIETMVIQTYKTYCEIQYIERYKISIAYFFKFTLIISR